MQVASLELKLKAYLVRIMLDFSKLQLFYFLVSCISLNYCIPFLGLPRDRDFSRTVFGFNYLFWNIMSFLCVDNFVQLNVFFLVTWMFFVWQGYSPKFYDCTSSTHYKPIWNTSCFASDVNWSSWNHSFRSIWNL